MRPAKEFERELEMFRHRNDRSGATTYWVRGGELLNVWIARYEPDSAAFEQEEGDWFLVSQAEILREVGAAFTDKKRRTLLEKATDIITQQAEDARDLARAQRAIALTETISVAASASEGRDSVVTARACRHRADG